MATEHGIDEKVLMEDGPWELRSTTQSSRMLRMTNLHSYIAHRCPYAPEDEYKWSYWWLPASFHGPCGNCHEYPPEKLETLWKLHNFDFIQERG